MNTIATTAEKIEPTKITSENEIWCMTTTIAELESEGMLMVRIEGKQIALFKTKEGVRACDNRCPHEGFPLSQGSLSDSCTLTCNWHNWKFNLDTGDNLYGGDRLRTYPVELRGNEIWVDISDPPYDERYKSIVNSLRDAFEDHAYDRIGREIARLFKIGADPLDSLRLAIDWSWQRMEFGWTHAYAGMMDWLTLYDETDDKELKLVCLMESVGHTSFDVLREPEFPYTKRTESYDQSGFLAAIEAEDEDSAVAMIRGGLKDGLGFNEFEFGFSHGALAHYNGFGHSLIYVSKAGGLIERLGSQVAAPLLLSLVRELIYSPRENKIPEFRHYDTALQKWGNHDGTEPDKALWFKLGINKALDATVSCSGAPPESIYSELLLANAVNMLRFDLSQQQKVHVSISGNVGWLDFTHGLTFANAVRKQCTRFPELWPNGLLQMACFSGRNAAFTTAKNDLDQWKIDHTNGEFDKLIQGLFDHGQDEYIVSVHLLKTALAVREEIQALDFDDEILGATLNRFFNSPLKRKQAQRTAYQSLQFVSKE